mgnify:CR=1 FL=1
MLLLLTRLSSLPFSLFRYKDVIELSSDCERDSTRSPRVWYNNCYSVRRFLHHRRKRSKRGVDRRLCVWFRRRRTISRRYHRVCPKQRVFGNCVLRIRRVLALLRRLEDYGNDRCVCSRRKHIVLLLSRVGRGHVHLTHSNV